MILSEEGFNKFFDNPLGCQEDRLKVFRDGFRRDSALCGSSLLFFLSLFHSSFIFLQYIDGFGERPRSYQRVALYDIKSGIGIAGVDYC